MNYLVFVVVYSIMVYGISNALVYFNGPFNIIDRFRTWISNKHKTFEELFSCMFCLPTNIGIILSIISMVFCTIPFTPFSIMFYEHYEYWPLVILFDAFFTGGITYIINTIQSKYDE